MSPRAEQRAPLGERAKTGPRQGRGETATAKTPLAIRTDGVGVTAGLKEHIAKRLGRQLGKASLHIERVTVRLSDVNGPRGGEDKVCAIKVVVSGLPSVVVEERAETKRVAFDLAAARCERALRKALEKGASSLAKRRPRRVAGKAPAEQRSERPEAGALIGRRVGRAAKNLTAALERPEKLDRTRPVDTARAGASASDRRAGAGSTARRNTKGDRAGMVSALEDSEQARPSRKSTRRSANRVKQSNQLERRAQRKATAPQARARRALVR